MAGINWTITFVPVEGGRYHVSVDSAGSSSYVSRLPPDITELFSNPDEPATQKRSFRGNVAELPPEAQFFSAGNLDTLKDIGERIYEGVFTAENDNKLQPDCGALLYEFRKNEDFEIRFDLTSAPDLSAVPWEALYIREVDRFLAATKNARVIRQVKAKGARPAPISKPIKILVAAANPHGDLDTSVEVGNISKRIDELVSGDNNDFVVETLRNVKTGEFRKAIQKFQPHIIHYIGHSAFKDGNAYLYFESDEEGKSERLKAETFANMLQNDRPWLVVLNSCQSGVTSSERPMAGLAQQLLSYLNIPFVVAMQQPVSDDAAITFSQSFYNALTDGKSISEAVSRGRQDILTADDDRTKIEVITPALYVSGDADRIEFVTAEAVEAPPAPKTGDTDEKSGILAIFGSKSTVIIVLSGLVAVSGLALQLTDNLTGLFERITGALPAQETLSADEQQTDAATIPGSDDVGGEGRATPAAIGTDPDGTGLANEQTEIRPSRPRSRSSEQPTDLGAAQTVVTRSIRQRARTIAAVTSTSLDSDLDGVVDYLEIEPNLLPPPPPPPPTLESPATYIAMPPATPVVVVGGIGETPTAANISVTYYFPFPVLAGTELAPTDPMFEPVGEETLASAVIKSADPENTPAYNDFKGVLVAYPYVASGAGEIAAAPIVYRDIMAAPVKCFGDIGSIDFEFGSSSITPGAADAVRAGLSRTSICPNTDTLIQGHSDSVGSREANKALSLQRSIAVADLMQLEYPGLAPGSMQIEGWGERRPEVETGDEIRDADNRSVDVSLVHSIGSAGFDTLGVLSADNPLAAVSDLPSLSEELSGADREVMVVRYGETSDAKSDALLNKIADAVAAQLAVAPKRVFPINGGPDRLSEGEQERFEVLIPISDY